MESQYRTMPTLCITSQKWVFNKVQPITKSLKVDTSTFICGAEFQTQKITLEFLRTGH